MANTFSATVYQINSNQPLSTPQLMGFPSTMVMFRPAASGTKAYDGTTDLYGIVQVLPTGLNIKESQYYVVETVSELVTKAG